MYIKRNVYIYSSKTYIYVLPEIKWETMQMVKTEKRKVKKVNPAIIRDKLFSPVITNWEVSALNKVDNKNFIMNWNLKSGVIIFLTSDKISFDSLECTLFLSRSRTD